MESGLSLVASLSSLPRVRLAFPKTARSRCLQISCTTPKGPSPKLNVYVVKLQTCSLPLFPFFSSLMQSVRIATIISNQGVECFQFFFYLIPQLTKYIIFSLFCFFVDSQILSWVFFGYNLDVSLRTLPCAKPQYHFAYLHGLC